MVEEQKEEQVLPVKPVSPSGGTTIKTETPKVETQPLTEERIQQLIAEATQKAIEQGRDVGRREMQGFKDKEVAEANRKVRQAEMRAKSYEESFTGLDEETRQAIELKQARGQVQYYQSAEQEETFRKQQEEQSNRLRASLNSHLETLGLKPDDTRIDWAVGEEPIAGLSRFNASVARILKEDTVKKEKDLETKLDTKFKDMELRWRKEQGLDSVDTSLGGGSSVEGIPTDPIKFREWIAKVPQKEYEEKYASKVNELRRQGKI